MARIWRMANNVRSSIDAGEYKDFNLAKGGVLPLAQAHGARRARAGRRGARLRARTGAVE